MGPRDLQVIGVGAVILAISIGGSFALAQPHREEGGGTAAGPAVALGTFTDSQTMQEGESATVPLGIPDLRVTWLMVNLTWTDESDASRHTNTPDSFRIDLQPPEGDPASDSGSNAQGGPGELTVSWGDPASTESPLTGEWTVVVTLEDAGDQIATFDLLGFRNQADSANAWDLEATFAYLDGGGTPK